MSSHAATAAGVGRERSWISATVNLSIKVIAAIFLAKGVVVFP
jgi:hypothetical protein